MQLIYIFYSCFLLLIEWETKWAFKLYLDKRAPE